MKIRSLFFIVFLILISVSVFAQETEKSLYEFISRREKKSDVFNLYLNTQTFLDVSRYDEKWHGLSFKLNKLRLQLEGDVNDRWYYYFQYVIKEDNEVQKWKDFAYSLEYAAIGINLNPNMGLILGKQDIAMGGFEFDADPTEIYEYSLFMEYNESYLPGVDFIWSPYDNHEFHFQVVRGRNKKFEDMFGDLPEGVRKSGLPLGYSFNWNGEFLDGLFNTRYSVNLFNDTRTQVSQYYVFGNQLVTEPFDIYFDVMYAREKLDREGILSAILYGEDYEYASRNTAYLSYASRMNFHIHPKWNLFLKGTYDKASLYKSYSDIEKGKYQVSYGYQGGVEFYPMLGNLHLFLTCIGRSYKYENKIKKEYELDNYNTFRFSLGFIYRIPIF